MASALKTFQNHVWSHILAFLTVENNCCYSWIHQEQFVYNSSIRDLDNLRKILRFLAFKTSTKNYNFAKFSAVKKSTTVHPHNSFVNVCFSFFLSVFYLCVCFLFIVRRKKDVRQSRLQIQRFSVSFGQRNYF